MNIRDQFSEMREEAEAQYIDDLVEAGEIACGTSLPDTPRTMYEFVLGVIKEHDRLQSHTKE